MDKLWHFVEGVHGYVTDLVVRQVQGAHCDQAKGKDIKYVLKIKRWCQYCNVKKRTWRRFLKEARQSTGRETSLEPVRRRKQSAF